MIKESVLPVMFGDSKTGKNKSRSLSVWKTEKGFKLGHWAQGLHSQVGGPIWILD